MNQKIIAIEGIDGVGKTFLCNKLKKISNETNTSSEVIPEFMDDFAGGYITKKLQSSKFISLDKNFDTSLAQTFFLVSSHLYKYEIAIQKYPKLSFLIFDRFLFSVLAYQMVILEKSNKIKIETIDAFYNSIKSLLPNNLTIIYLSCEKSILTKRFTLRGDNYTKSDFEFLSEVSKKYNLILNDCKIPIINMDASSINDTEVFDLLKKILIL